MDAEGVGLGMFFNEQRTFSEWRNSDFAQVQGQTCQDCHMPAIGDAAGCKEFVTLNLAHATGGRLHQLVGANVGTMKALRELYGAAGAMEVDDFFVPGTGTDFLSALPELRKYYRNGGVLFLPGEYIYIYIFICT